MTEQELHTLCITTWYDKSVNCNRVDTRW